jgi:hypothetical protein
MQTKVVIALLIVLCCVMGVSMLHSWFNPASTPNTTQYTVAPSIKEVERIKVVTVPGPTQIITIEKEKVVEKLKLPDEIAKNPDKQVVATATIAPYEGDTHAVAVMDTKTGQGSILVEPQPLSLFAFENRKEIGIRGGIGTEGKQGDLYGRYTFLRVGHFHASAYGEIAASEKGSGNGKAMIELGYRF